MAIRAVVWVRLICRMYYGSCTAKLFYPTTHEQFLPKTRLLTSNDSPKAFVITNVNQGHFPYSQYFRIANGKHGSSGNVWYKDTIFDTVIKGWSNERGSGEQERSFAIIC